MVMFLDSRGNRVGNRWATLTGGCLLLVVTPAKNRLAVELPLGLAEDLSSAGIPRDGMTAQGQEQQQKQEKNEVNNPTLNSQRRRV